MDPTATIARIMRIEKIHRSAVGLYWVLVVVCAVIGFVVFLVGTGLKSSDQAKAVFQLSGTFVGVLAGLPGGAIYVRFDRLKALESFREELAKTPKDSPDAARIDEIVWTVFSKMAGT